MLNSMTGFGSSEAKVVPYGKISVEMRSSNHKFLETVFHLPEGFLVLEERLKKEIEARIKRGRLVCVINVLAGESKRVFINERLLKEYLLALRNIKKYLSIQDELSINTLVHLPGVLSLAESRVPKEKIWPCLKILLNRALNDLLKMRAREGRAMCVYLNQRAKILKSVLASVRTRFKKLIQNKISQIPTDEERLSFLKNTDITEEMERLSFHIGNFQNRLLKSGSLGKELDFIAQEMQREANTMAAKSFDALISTRMVQIKSQIEKIREQVQNIE